LPHRLGQDYGCQTENSTNGNGPQYLPISLTRCACCAATIYGFPHRNTRLRRAIESDELTLFFQPQFDVTDGQACGVEALQAVQAWRIRGSASVTLCVNVSAQQLNRTFAKTVQRVSKCTGKDVSIVRAIIELGKELGIAVIAEGVETEQQFQVLKNLGCLQVQGYLLARPIPQKEARDVIKQWGGRHHHRAAIGAAAPISGRDAGCYERGKLTQNVAPLPSDALAQIEPP
jgi:hypothetical protein